MIRKFLLSVSRKFLGWPPSPVSDQEKRAILGRIAEKWNVKNLIETGTFRGDMVEAQRERFDRIVTIELAEPLWRAARERFASFAHIEVILGDSGEKLNDALRLTSGPVLFWLDGHYSGGETTRGDEDCPILKELAIIAARREDRDVVLIDDARLFGWRKSYPRMSKMREETRVLFPNHEMSVADDMIQIVPRSADSSSA